jgi:hypothetical protein
MRWDILEVVVAIGAIIVLAAWFRWGSPVRDTGGPPRKPDDRGDLEDLD